MKIPFQRIQARLQAASEDGQAPAGRVKRCMWYSGAAVIRGGWGEPYKLQLSMDPTAVNLTRLNNGAPVLDTHNDYHLATILGVVERGWIEKGRGYADLRFSEREDVEPVWKDIQVGIIRNVSVGAAIHSLKDISGEDDKVKTYLATNWEPMEISIVPVGADPNAGIQLSAETRFTEATILGGNTEFPNQGLSHPAKEHLMEENKPPDAGAESRNTETKEELAEQIKAAELERVRTIGATAENARVTAIIETCKACGLDADFGVRHIKAGTSIDEFRRLAIDRRATLAAAQPEVRGVVAEIMRDETNTRRAGMIGSLLERFQPAKWMWDDHQLTYRYVKNGGQEFFEPARQYVGLSLLDVAKQCLADRGIHWQSKNRSQIATLAFETTSDFPDILANVANKTLRAGYEMSESQWRLISARRTAPDFKQVSELQLDSSSDFDKIPDSGEYKRGSLVEGKEVWQLATYGKIIGVTRSVIINDDLNAFTRTPFLLGQSAAKLEADIVFGIITTNPAMSDSHDLLDGTNHFNVVASGSAISISSLSDGRVLMMTQKSSGGKPLNIAPRFLLAPAAQFTLAQQYTSTAYQSTQPSNINPFAGGLVPIGESRLDASDTYAWYLFGDPESPNGACLIHGFLEGESGPYSENRQGFDVDGVEIKIRHDFAAAAVDYRGIVKNPGH